MASSFSSSSSPLVSQTWVPVDLGGSRFLCKSRFGRSQYHVLLLDGECLWEERMEAQEIQTRAQELNRRLRSSIESFFSHLVSVVTPCLTGSGRDCHTGNGADLVTLQRVEGHMTLRLRSELAGLPFYWEFHCRPAPVSKACVQLVRPLLVMSGVLHTQVALLVKLLQRKDAEIQDYRESGAQLTRERLQTEPFEEEAFRLDFMSKTLPMLLDQGSSLDFDPDLQDLFSSIGSELNPNKRKRQDSGEGEEEREEEREEDREEEDREEKEEKEERTAADQQETTAQTRGGDGAVDLSQKVKTQTPVKKTTIPTMQQAASSPLRATDRPAPKPKKKRVGLFR